MTGQPNAKTAPMRGTAGSPRMNAPSAATTPAASPRLSAAMERGTAWTGQTRRTVVGGGVPVSCLSGFVFILRLHSLVILKQTNIFFSVLSGQLRSVGGKARA